MVMSYYAMMYLFARSEKEREAIPRRLNQNHYDFKDYMPSAWIRFKKAFIIKMSICEFFLRVLSGGSQVFHILVIKF